MKEIATLQQKLALLRSADLQFRVIGSAAHHYIVNPCLDEETVQSFETRHHIQLPSDYRQFLLHIGDGGAGPRSGIVPLTQAVISPTPDFLSQPFPYTTFWNGMEPPDWFDRGLSPDEIEQVSRAIDASAYFAEHHRQGTLPLAHEGCGYYPLLVVSGPEKGHMWLDARVSDGGIHPLPDYRSAERITFAQWYESWLDLSLQQVGVKVSSTKE